MPALLIGTRIVIGQHRYIVGHAERNTVFRRPKYWWMRRR